MASVLDRSLLLALQDAIPHDPEMSVVGRFFSCTMLVASDAERFLLEFENGKLVRMTPQPHPADAWQFAIKAPAETWSRFLADPPPAEYNDVWAAAWLGHMTIEGDMKVFMQNHYAIWRALKILRAQAQVAATS